MLQTTTLSILKTGINVFLTGEPGSGKTYVLQQYVRYLREHKIEVAITASTGIAATHIGGMTIHSWSGMGIKDSLTKKDLEYIKQKDYVMRRIRNASVLVIDEISMLGPDMLANVDLVCRTVRENSNSFGGLQVVLVGDFFQLPPVVRQFGSSSPNAKNQTLLADEKPKKFAYHSPAWERGNFAVCYLSEQHRQDDTDFTSLLAALRRNDFLDEHREHLKHRFVASDDAPGDIPKLFSHNVNVDTLNNSKLGEINEPAKRFTMTNRGRDALVAALIKGCLSPEILVLKVGAKVMFTKNNPKEGFMNGTLGEVIGFDDDTHFPVVRVDNYHEIIVTPASWIVEENGKEKAAITQLPLRLAWAITVHKSQGMSLDAAVMDLSQVFEFGQGYVALSRVRRLSGLYLIGWHDRALAVDPEVLADDLEFRKESDATELKLANMPAAGVSELQKNFIIRSGGTLKTEPIVAPPKPIRVKPEKISTVEKTRRLIADAKSIEEIADARGFSIETIINHLQELKLAQKISHTDIAHLKPADSRFDEVCKIIFPHFEKLGTEKLSPVFRALKGKYNYDTLHLVRLFFE